MNVSVSFLADLTIALTLAVTFGIVAERLRLNAIVGYLAAGIVIGRFTPGYVANTQTVETLAQLGLIFLLFSLGLGFSFDEVKALGIRALVGNALAMSLGVGAAGIALALLSFRHPWTAAVATAVSSTAVGVALLRSWNVETDAPGRFTIAQQVVQDLVAVALIVVVTAPPASLTPLGIELPLFKAVLFVAVALAIGATILHRLVQRLIFHAASDVLFGIFSALALVAAWLGYIAGLSFEFGAFVAGAVISEAAGSAVVSSVVAPFRSLFVTLFFVSVGMLIDVSFFMTHWFAIVATGIGLAIVRCALWFRLARLAAMTVAGAVLVGVGMASLGEFNVVLITEAQRSHRLLSFEAQTLLDITFVTMIACALTGPWLARLRGPWTTVRVNVDGEAGAGTKVAILGFGRVGQTVASVLRDAGIPYVALERDKTTVYRMRENGHNVILGDASDPVALDRLHAENLDVLVITLPDTPIADIVTQRMKARSRARLIVRARTGKDVELLRTHGASMVLVPEIEGALSFAEAVMRTLDVAPERVEERLDAQRHRLDVADRSTL